MAGLKMEMKEDPDGNGRLQFLSYCPKHCRPRPELSGEGDLRLLVTHSTRFGSVLVSSSSMQQENILTSGRA
jgi:hypothetical protein